jgi:hypothetical protein
MWKETMSRVRGSVTNNNGFWIGRLDLLTPFITITLNYNQYCLRLAPFLTTVFSSSRPTATDLVLICESVTSSASVVR